MDTLERTELDQALDFTPELPCEGLNHASSTLGHAADQPGTILITSPCCGRSIIHCAARIAAMRFDGEIRCSPCGITHEAEAYTFTHV